jgi:hypothetical protein
VLEAVEASIRQDMAGASVDVGAALALAAAFGVEGRAAAYLIMQAARGIAVGGAKRGEISPDQEYA